MFWIFYKCCCSMTANDHLETAMHRNPIPPGQLTLYKTLWEAHGHVGREQLIARMNRTPGKDLNGVMGALGTRISHTPGLEVPEDVQPTELLLHKQKGSDGKLEYRLRSEARCVIENIDGLLDALDEPIDALDEHSRKF
jgi:hypothetical protein